MVCTIKIMAFQCNHVLFSCISGDVSCFENTLKRAQAEFETFTLRQKQSQALFELCVDGKNF